MTVECHSKQIVIRKIVLFMANEDKFDAFTLTVSRTAGESASSSFNVDSFALALVFATPFEPTAEPHAGPLPRPRSVDDVGRRWRRAEWQGISNLQPVCTRHRPVIQVLASLFVARTTQKLPVSSLRNKLVQVHVPGSVSALRSHRPFSRILPGCNS